MNDSDTFSREHLDYLALRESHWSRVAERVPGVLSRRYRRRLAEVYAHIVDEADSILEVGCGQGDLLGGLKARRKVGLDLSPRMVGLARDRHRDASFIHGDVQTMDLGDETFDVIIMSDVLNDLWDVQAALESLKRNMHAGTRLIFNVQSHLWESMRRLGEKIGIVTPNLVQNWLTPIDIENLLELAGLQQVRRFEEVLCPLPLPLIADLFDKFLVKLPLFRSLALTNFYVARLGSPKKREASVSVVIAARNEAGHIDELLQRIPEMGAHTEIVFVEGNSSDDTYAVIERAIARSRRDCRLLKQSGKGKGDAVRAGFDVAKGDILMILDADITVPPEDLPRFYDVLASGQGEFANGVRLVYPMQDEAMRFFNLLGNKFFSWAFSWLLGQPIRDTLCGTKVLWTEDYRKIARGRKHYGDFDPFGDFDLLFGAARQNRRIVEVPIRYRARRYGETNIQRWRHGVLLLRMVVFAARRIKFR